MEKKKSMAIHEGHTVTLIFNTPKAGLKHSVLLSGPQTTEVKNKCSCSLQPKKEITVTVFSLWFYCRRLIQDRSFKIYHKKSFPRGFSWIVVLIIPCSHAPPGITQWLIIRKSAEALQRKSIAKSWRRFREYHIWRCEGSLKRKTSECRWLSSSLCPKYYRVINTVILFFYFIFLHFYL